jgi:CopG family nickel-responsive transcriptional regulator
MADLGLACGLALNAALALLGGGSLALGWVLFVEKDRRLAAEGFKNRSDALAHLMRQHLLAEKIRGNAEVVGVVTMVYDHHRRELSQRLTQLQHDHHTHVLSNLHIHLTHTDCLEVVVIRGTAGRVQELADRLISTHGVKSGRVFIPAAVDE